ncbi:MAG: molybdopterin cofactor-binding domain-containing protein [Chitinophagaceae bacterium]
MQRRNFLKISSLMSGGWLLAQMLPIKGIANTTEHLCFQPSPLIKICDDGKIYIYVLKQESGQGVQTSFPMIVAEELEANINDIIVEPLPFDATKGGRYGTGGSTSVMTQYDALRKAGATAREMLITAASNEWGVPSSQCKAERSKVTDTVSGKELSYAELYTKAAKLDVPKTPALKNYKDFKIIGKPGQKKTNIKNIVTGKYTYGIDIKLPEMLYGAVVRCPVLEGKVKNWDESSIKKIEGIVKLVEMKEMGVNNRNGVGIIATNRWSAMKAAQQLKVNWDLGKHATTTSKQYSTSLKKALKTKANLVVDASGKPAELIPSTSTTKLISAEYELPFLAHATMEPVNCIAQFKNDKFEIWGGFQSPGSLSSVCSKFFGVKNTDVFINLQPMGGGFGRKLSADYGGEAMQLASHANGKPVQLLFSRAEDMKFGVFRPASVHSLHSEINTNGMPTNWEHRIAIAPVMDSQGKKGNPNNLQGELGGGADNDMYYNIPILRGAVHRTESPLAEGWWRAVNFTYNNFVIESFIDEIAKAQNKDSLAFRLSLLASKESTMISGAKYNPQRLATVLQEAANLIEWNKKRSNGTAVGIACCFYNHAMAYTAHAFEVTVKNKVVTIHKAVCVSDIGTVIDPDGLENQIQGGFVWGMSEVLKSEITLQNGMVQQNHFRDFEVMRMGELPPLTIKIIKSTEPPGGAGETSVPSVKPALCNAIAAACGIRVRKLPLKNEGFTLK